MATSDPRRGRQLLDAVGYALAVTAVVFALGLGVRTLGGSGWFVVELVMFLLGWVLIGYGTLLLNPDPPWSTTERDDQTIRVTDAGDGTGSGTGTATPPPEETAFQRAVQRLPPMRWYQLPPGERLSTGLRVFLSGVVVLLASIAIERLLVV